MNAIRANLPLLYSFSLYGNKPEYNNFSVLAIKSVKELDPDGRWCAPLVIHSTDTDPNVLDSLREAGALLQPCPQWLSKVPGKFWRFYSPIFYPNADAYAFRDADSLVIPRELNFTNEWLASDSSFHSIRDHPNHIAPIQAGLFSAKGSGVAILLDNLLLMHHKIAGRHSDHFVDQIFLASIYRKYQHHFLVHTSGPVIVGEKFIFSGAGWCDHGFCSIGERHVNINSGIGYPKMIKLPSPAIYQYIGHISYNRILNICVRLNFLGARFFKSDE